MGGAPEAGSVSYEEMKKQQIPLRSRDECVHLLVPLNKCRRATGSRPYKCEHERHAYEKCQYDEYKKRVKQLDQMRKDGKAK